MSARPRPVCIASYPDLMARMSAVSDLYASTDDGGFPGTPAARRYTTDRDAIYAEAAARTARIIRFALTGAAS